MKITWLGHASFRLEIADQIILIDPWLDGNPSFPNDQREAAIQGATHILLTHAHDDHATDALALAKSDGLVLVGQFDLMNWWETSDKIKTIGMNKGEKRMTLLRVTSATSVIIGSRSSPVSIAGITATARTAMMRLRMVSSTGS
mgnify:CR=1 FL=1